MKKRFNLYARWLLAGPAILILLTLIFARVEPSAAHHSYPTHTPTVTPTATRPALEQCNAVAFFEPQKPSYQVGEEVNVTIRVTYKGQPLIGANVDAVVTRTSLASVQAAEIPPLEDQSGDYEEIFVPELAGNYTFAFAINDPSGNRFLPCTATATMRVDLAECQIKARLDPDQSPYQVNDPITLSADVVVNDVIQHTATVTATVDRPDSPPEDLLSFSGDGPYTGVYTRTNLPGDYIFRVSASEPERFSCQADPITVPVEREPQVACIITKIEFDDDEYDIHQAINLTATVENTNNTTATVTSVVTRPTQLADPPFTLNPVDNIRYTGRYPDTGTTGVYTFTVTATDPTGGQNFQPCTNVATTTVTSVPTNSTIIRVDPITRTGTLCDMTLNSSVIAERISNLSSISLEIHYNPLIVQVIDAINRPAPPVQVRPGAILSSASITRNEVDTDLGKIFFEATFASPITINQLTELISIDWRPQRVGTSPVTFAKAILKDSAGQDISFTPGNGAVQIDFVDNCLSGTAALQGRSDHSGVIVAGEGGEQVQSDVDGYFAIIAKDSLAFTYPGYLPARVDLGAALQSAPPEGEAYKLGPLNLLAGDVNGDRVIDILDLAAIASRYGSQDSGADINADGRVDILDLALVAGNYGRQ